MNQGPVIRLQKDAFSFLLLFFPGSLKKKKKSGGKTGRRKIGVEKSGGKRKTGK